MRIGGKDMKQLANKYNHKEVEKGKYQDWIEKGYFTAGDMSKKPYCVVIPPPNVTGMLHLGHAYNTTLQDALCRYKRLKGFDVLWVPGMDHAGIATQAKVEKKLREQGINKYDIGREEFLKVAWQWKKDYAETIRSQWAKMGLSLDYTREAFTLDEKRNEAVRKVFVSLYEKGYIYRKEKIINWDPVLKTALSNIEVIYKEVEGHMYYFRYYIENSNQYIVVGTTRPETMFGDVAVVVNPKDERYQFLKGKKLINPANGDLLEVIFDPYVDVEFATGAMKCTPAHDPNDYALGIKYNLPQIVCMNLDATMNEKAGKYANLDRFVCREKLVEELKEKNLVEKIEKHLHQVGHSERSDSIIEPTLSKQWFVAMKKLAQNSLDKQKSSQGVHFYPTRFEKIFVNWMENIEDWCISRQLWWGHRIPAYYKKDSDELLVSFNPPADIENYVQDEDVLDTWFSSALWPFTTLGWPDNTEDLKRYYPNDLLVTAYDIIFFWVSRMMFEALEFTDTMPFKDVLIHGLIRDEQGRKMSKSLGNGIDPIAVIDEYGADALRFFLATNSAPGLDFRFSTEKIASSWNFINKIWNASRFVLLNLPRDFKVQPFMKEKMTLADQWILARLSFTMKMISENMEKYEFANVGTYLTNFIWDDFCSWYIEMSKLSLMKENVADNTRQVLFYVLKSIIILLEPFVPFVSEELYSCLPEHLESINQEKWPALDESYDNAQVVREMNEIIAAISAIRNLRNTENIANATKLDMKIYAKNENAYHYYLNNIDYLIKFGNANSFAIVQEAIKEDNGTIIPLNEGELFISFKNAIDYEKELEKLNLELKKWNSEVKRSESILNNENFLKKAPEQKIIEEKKKLTDYLSKKESVEKHIAEIKKRING